MKRQADRHYKAAWTYMRAFHIAIEERLRKEEGDVYGQDVDRRMYRKLHLVHANGRVHGVVRSEYTFDWIDVNETCDLV